MATKAKTRVSASTKKALNEMRKARAERQAEMAKERIERINAVNAAFAQREREPHVLTDARMESSYQRARQQVQRSVIDSISMGTHSRQLFYWADKEVKCLDGEGNPSTTTIRVKRPIDIEVNFFEGAADEDDDENEVSKDNEDSPLSGWNNSKKIYVGINGELFAEATSMQGFQFVNRDVAETIFDALIGVGYHEIGHSVHSPNYDRLLNIAAMKYRDQFTDRDFWWDCLNSLDDQRMETAMVMWSPNLARSLTSACALILTSASRFNLMHGRFYLPAEVQEEARADYEAAYGADNAQGVADAIDAYLVAESYDEMADALAAFVALVPECKGKGKSRIGRRGKGDMTDQPEGAGASDAQVKKDGKAIAKDKDKLQNGSVGSDATNAAKEMARDFQRDMGTEGYGTIDVPEEKMTTENLAAADALGQDIARRLRSAAAGNAHRWADRQRQGIVNGFQYKTRPSRAEMNFFRAEAGSASLGFDLDVVVLLDVSGSMGSYIDELSICGHAIKAACDELGTHCTVGLYSNSYQVLYPSYEKASGIQLEPLGSTRPKLAFEDVYNQRSDVRHSKTQLVIVLTDGHFSCPIAPYEDTNQHWIGVALDSNAENEGPSISLMTKVAGLRRNGFQDTEVISNPIQLAAVLENWLHDTVVAA